MLSRITKINWQLSTLIRENVEFFGTWHTSICELVNVFFSNWQLNTCILKTKLSENWQTSTNHIDFLSYMLIFLSINIVKV